MNCDPGTLLGYILYLIMLSYNSSIFLFFWLFYDDNRILTVKKAYLLKKISVFLLSINIILYIPYLYMYNFLIIIFDKLPSLWITILPTIFSWVDIKLSNSLLNKAKENIEQ